MNYFNTSLSQMEKFEKSQLPYILESIKEGARLVNERLNERILAIQMKKDYIRVELPVQWAQSLNNVLIEVRYAHRHDAPGCSTVEDE